MRVRELTFEEMVVDLIKRMPEERRRALLVKWVLKNRTQDEVLEEWIRMQDREESGDDLSHRLLDSMERPSGPVPGCETFVRKEP